MTCPRISRTSEERRQYERQRKRRWRERNETSDEGDSGKGIAEIYKNSCIPLTKF